ncbi:hypothetical protein ANN_20742 [Periplaneta americana]|uniref:Uncharacterized protein n=1 Tax=Periplaneta americana TaxID=6978 RepID=A0ABQ8SEJ6_PERAM|nr:hypothetical protein ANN_20742 [Periplaneta americana]
MAGLCESGNEPPGSLKVIIDGCNATLNSHLFSLVALRSLPYIITLAAIVICWCMFSAIVTMTAAAFIASPSSEPDELEFEVSSSI